MIAALVERDRRLASVQSPAVMEYTAGDQHLKAKEEIVAKRPDKLRVEAMSPFGVALLLAAQGPDLTIFEPGKNRFMRGQANADTLYKYVRIPMEPKDAVGLLMGLAPPAFELGNSPDSVSKDGAMIVATFGNSAVRDASAWIFRWQSRDGARDGGRRPASTTKCATATITISAA